MSHTVTNQTAARLVGMDIGGTSTRIVVLDRDWNYLGFARLPACATAAADDSLGV